MIADGLYANLTDKLPGQGVGEVIRVKDGKIERGFGCNPGHASTAESEWLHDKTGRIVTGIELPDPQPLGRPAV